MLSIQDLRDAAWSLARAAEHEPIVDIPIVHGAGTVPAVEALRTWEADIGTHARALGQGPVPLALNQARTALGGAIGLCEMAGDWAPPQELIINQLYLAAGYLTRALGAGSVVGSG